MLVSYTDRITGKIYNVNVHENLVPVYVRRTVAHILGNEVKSAIPTNGEDENHAQAVDEWRLKKIAKIESGEALVREGGPRRDPLEVEMEAEAIRRLKAAAKAQGQKLPTKMDGEYQFANGMTLTLREMVDRKLGKEGEDIERVAKRLITERDRAARKQAEQTKENTAEAFGI